MSSVKSRPPNAGADTAMGLVPNIASRPKVGTPRAAVFVMQTPIMPRRAAISAYQPAMPKWLESRTEAKATPEASALAITRSMVFLLRLSPMAPRASSTRETGVSRKVSGCTPPAMIPLRSPLA